MKLFHREKIKKKSVITTINFKEITQSVSVRDYAKYLGLEVHRGSKIVCPFHSDKNPSMKVDSRFHCFGCGEDGDVIDFVSKYFDISKTDAAKKIASEFGISSGDDYNFYRQRDRPVKQKLNYKQMKNNAVLYLTALEKELKLWLEEYRPKPGDEELHFLFVTATQNIGYVSYLIDTLSELKTDEEIKRFFKNHEGEVIV